MAQDSNFRLFNPEGLSKPTRYGYSHLGEVRAGRTVYISGQIALDASGNLVGKGDLRAQTQQVFENLKIALAAAGATFNDVIKINTYCADSVDDTGIALILEIRSRYLNQQTPPASTFVIVRRLVRPEWLIEVEAVAVV
jgi:enamine deaminase RidA (YjgF/YER057c/UK114 family)